ncbi:MAG TPA: hypothetical protein VFX58_06125 [Chitinophagaceae bacterium]|nr:hypothetical protein [Chitinophagaceae bacterium]
MIPRVWKLFRILNYVQLISSAVITLFVSFIILSSFTEKNISVLGFTYIFGLLFLLICLSSILNSYIILKFFPDKPMSRAMSTLFVSTLIVSTLTCLCLLGISITGLSIELDATNEKADRYGLITGLVLLLLSLVHVFVLIMQYRVKKFIRLNQAKTMASLIASIGSQPESGKL